MFDSLDSGFLDYSATPRLVQHHDTRETVNKTNGTWTECDRMHEMSCYKRDRLTNNGTLYFCRVHVEVEIMMVC